MSKILILSDLHFYRNASRSYIIPETGLTSWLTKQLDVVNKVLFYAIEQGIVTVIINGDIFEEKNHINQTTYNLVWGLFNEYSNKLRMCFNVGNHDISTIAENTSLRPFSTVGTVYLVRKDFNLCNSWYDFIIDNTYIKLLPYGRISKESLYTKKKKDKFNILLTHEYIDGLVWNNSDKAKLDPIDKALFKEYTWVFNGHVHKAQESGNIVNVGAISQHTFGEKGEDKRFIIYDCETGTWESIPIKTLLQPIEFFHFPEYTEDVKKLLDSDNTNMYSVVVDSSFMSDLTLKKYNVFPQFRKKEKRKVRLDSNTDTEDIENYVEISETKLDRDRLKELGKQLMVKKESE